jgi:hypothetical protein
MLPLSEVTMVSLSTLSEPSVAPFCRSLIMSSSILMSMASCFFAWGGARASSADASLTTISSQSAVDATATTVNSNQLRIAPAHRTTTAQFPSSEPYALAPAASYVRLLRCARAVLLRPMRSCESRIAYDACLQSCTQVFAR